MVLHNSVRKRSGKSDIPRRKKRSLDQFLQFSSVGEWSTINRLHRIESFFACQKSPKCWYTIFWLDRRIRGLTMPSRDFFGMARQKEFLIRLLSTAAMERLQFKRPSRGSRLCRGIVFKSSMICLSNHSFSPAMHGTIYSAPAIHANRRSQVLPTNQFFWPVA
jgi:hypothetical protein